MTVAWDCFTTETSPRPHHTPQILANWPLIQQYMITYLLMQQYIINVLFPGYCCISISVHATPILSFSSVTCSPTETYHSTQPQLFSTCVCHFSIPLPSVKTISKSWRYWQSRIQSMSLVSMIWPGGPIGLCRWMEKHSIACQAKPKLANGGCSSVFQ